MDWLVAGLGNPGVEYELTPHNMGFLVCDFLSSLFDFEFSFNSKFKGLLGVFTLRERSIAVLKPVTYMNLSGYSVKSAILFYKLPLDRVLVIHDDIDLPFGKIKIKRKSSSGGHRGVQSIIDALGSIYFTRVKIGVGREGNPVNYVLRQFEDRELEEVDGIVRKVSNAVVDIVERGVEYAMNRYNGKNWREIDNERV